MRSDVTTLRTCGDADAFQEKETGEIVCDCPE